MEIRDKIREWYLINLRSLPWRKTSDPYHIWVSEIILQQTRIIQGIDYYHNFLEAFPDLESLARADEAEVLKVWEGLGYYCRARNMHAAAKFIYHEKDGVFPKNYSALLELKGVGPYTAAAISSIAFNEPCAVVDGNVHRVLSRLFGIEEASNGYRASSKILREAETLLDRENPGMHNQAVMELGALVCTPSQPDCPSCPLQDHCFAYLHDRTEEFPARSTRITRRKRYFHYLVMKDNAGIWLGKRMGKDIWQGLYEFPLIETPRALSTKYLCASDAWSVLFESPVHPFTVSGPVKHILSHQEIHARFYHLSELNSFNSVGYNKVSLDQLDRYPLPKLILNYLEKLRD